MTGSLITRAQHESHQGKLRAAPPQFYEPNKGRKREKTVQNHGTCKEEAAPNYEETGRRTEKEQRYV